MNTKEKTQRIILYIRCRNNDVELRLISLGHKLNLICRSAKLFIIHVARFSTYTQNAFGLNRYSTSGF